MQAEQKNSSTIIQKEAKLMKHVLTTNCPVDKVYPSRIFEAKSRCSTEHVFACEETLMHNPGFEECLLEAVDEELSSLGEAVKRIIYFHLKRTFKITKEEIPHRIAEFSDAIEKILGDGAKFLEIQIMRRLYEKLGKDTLYVTDKDILVFTEYVEAARLASCSP
jgi:hypothetical protein